MHDIRQLVLAVLCAFATASARAAPATYLDYIESNGSSQYIDLGIEGRCNLEVEAELAYVKMRLLRNPCEFEASHPLRPLHALPADSQALISSTI